MSRPLDGRTPHRDRVVVRPIAPGDLAEVLVINASNVPEVGDIDMAQLRFLVEESVIALVVADEGAASPVLGFCLVLAPGSTYDSVNYRWFMEHHPDSLYLDRVAFAATAQGRGLGSLLYGEVDRMMRDAHTAAAALTLEVNVDPPNEPSLRFHHKLGFVEVGRQMSKGIEVSLMRRDVQG